MTPAMTPSGTPSGDPTAASSPLECVVNVSEGRDPAVLAVIAAAGSDCLLDVHTDGDHHRSVLTLGGPGPRLEEAVRAVARAAVQHIDIRRHQGVHPRLGALDVVPFVPLGPGGSPVGLGGDLTPALEARNRFAAWAGDELGVPCFLYGPERSLPEVRRRAFAPLSPDTGPQVPHPRAGACAVGARPALVAYNLWLDSSDVELAAAVAGAIRGPAVRALGLGVAGTTQVSCNLVDPFVVGPAQVYESVRSLAHEAGTRIERAELVGLAPAAVVAAVAPEDWGTLDLGPDRTVEARLVGPGTS
jgi:glutamate formiminotransferase / 5-formyltetrahydrofolate cyclo-ligase